MELVLLIIYIVVFLYSVILHEIAHGWVASYFGDDTAKTAGRLSLNPLVHIDFFGSVIVPLLLIFSNAGFLFGWAKPVPINPYRLKGGSAAYRWVAAAGPLTNFILAIVAILVLKITLQSLGFASDNLGVIFFIRLLQINVVLGIFNALPLPGFDGFNFLTTFGWFGRLLSRTPLVNPLFMVRYGLLVSLLLLFIFMPLVSQLFSLVFNFLINLFGLS